MKHSIRVALNYDAPNTYNVELVENKKLVKIAECGSEREAIRTAKKYLEGREKKGDEIWSVYGTLYLWTGKEWQVNRPNN